MAANGAYLAIIEAFLCKYFSVKCRHLDILAKNTPLVRKLARHAFFAMKSASRITSLTAHTRFDLKERRDL